MNMCGKHIHQENKDMFRSLWFKICWHQLFRGNSTESPLSIKLLSIYRTSGIQLHSRPHPIEAGVDLVVTCLRLEKIDLVELERAMGESPENYSSKNLQNPLDCSGSDSIPNLFVQGLNAPFEKNICCVLFCEQFQPSDFHQPLAPPWLSAPDSDQNLWRGKQWCTAGTASQNSSVSSKGPKLHDKVGWNLLRNGETRRFVTSKLGHPTSSRRSASAAAPFASSQPIHSPWSHRKEDILWTQEIRTSHMTGG